MSKPPERGTPAPAPAPAPAWDDDAEPWRHPPVAPRDASIADSIGRSVSDVVTGPLDDAEGKPAPQPRP
ncbi:MAG: hypothetical protein ABI699_07120 [Caldimonas sp.]